ncbi:MAG: FliM/FliN family flagellar motor switch protein [Pseudomonadota bacterium]
MSTTVDVAEMNLPPAISGLTVELSVRIGTSLLTLKELGALNAGSLLTLRESADRPLELCANGHVIARGELEETDDGEGLALRITEIVGSVAG